MKNAWKGLVKNNKALKKSEEKGMYGTLPFKSTHATGSLFDVTARFAYF